MKKLPVLIVDDNEANILVLSSLLELVECDHQIARNGADAVKLFRKQKFSLVLMDLQMPIMSGIEATKMIRHYELTMSLKPTPIIAVTANSEPIYRAQCRACGMSDFITKPYTPEIISKVVEQYARV